MSTTTITVSTIEAIDLRYALQVAQSVIREKSMNYYNAQELLDNLEHIETTLEDFIHDDLGLTK